MKKVNRMIHNYSETGSYGTYVRHACDFVSQVRIDASLGDYDKNITLITIKDINGNTIHFNSFTDTEHSYLPRGGDTIIRTPYAYLEE